MTFVVPFDLYLSLQNENKALMVENNALAIQNNNLMKDLVRI